MFVSNIRLDFYDVIAGSRVLLLVGADVDGICACKILQFLFQCDNTEYTLISVQGKSSLIAAFNKHKNQAQYVLMLNCGATVGLVEELNPPEETVFFVADSNRPVNVYNIYSQSQVKLLMNSEDCENIPPYEDIFKDEEENEEEDEAFVNDEMYVKRRERKLWEEKRERILYDYYQLAYYGEPTSCLMFDLSNKLSLDNNDLLYWTIIGLTEQQIMKKTEEVKYMYSVTSMQNHVSRHNRVENGQNPISRLKISFEKELNLCLYRHWSLYESLIHSQYTACQFKLWTFKGKKRLLQFLVEMGLPLVQCKQKYSNMDLDFKNNVCGSMEDMAEKYTLEDIVYGSFIFQFGYKGKFSAADIVLGLQALLESTDKDKSQADKFLDALYALSELGKGGLVSIRTGINIAKDRIIAIFQQVQNFINMNHVIRTGPFFYAIVPTSSPDVRYFCQPGGLSLLAHYLLEAVVSNSKSARAETYPLLVFAQDPCDADMCLVVGVPPRNQPTKNFFGKAFEQVAENAKIKISQDLFSACYTYIHSNDQGKFLNNLYLLLS